MGEREKCYVPCNYSEDKRLIISYRSRDSPYAVTDTFSGRFMGSTKIVSFKLVYREPPSSIILEPAENRSLHDSSVMITPSLPAFNPIFNEGGIPNSSMRQKCNGYIILSCLVLMWLVIIIVSGKQR